MGEYNASKSVTIDILTLFNRTQLCRFRGKGSHPLRVTMGGLPGKLTLQPDAWITAGYLPALEGINIILILYHSTPFTTLISIFFSIYK
jgi:hypothetical protein